MPDEVAQWTLTTLRERLVKIGVRIVRQGRYMVFPLAEGRSGGRCSPRSCGASTGCEDRLWGGGMT